MAFSIFDISKMMLVYPQSCLKPQEKADDSDFKFSTGTIVPVDIDTEDYRKKHETRAVKKNCTIPSWLNDEAEAAGINFSRVLQDALIERLNLKESR